MVRHISQTILQQMSNGLEEKNRVKAVRRIKEQEDYIKKCYKQAFQEAFYKDYHRSVEVWQKQNTQDNHLKEE